jgi:hypothetical protein
MYLERVKLLPKVQLLSTVSGGTFTGAKYVLSVIDGVAPAEFFAKYYQDLRESRIFPNALQILGSDQTLQTPNQRKTIVTCAAQSYCETLFQRSGQPILFEEILKGGTGPLSEIAFNATDFKNGNSFRFQKSKKGKVGNGKHIINKIEAEQIRLGDIVAASSCFPAGFEPIKFPGDFAWPGGIVPSGIQAKGKVALMDGGIFDNQGMDTMLRNIKDTSDVDMIILSDTDRQKESLYQIPDSVRDVVRKPGVKANFLWKLVTCLNPTLGTLAWITWFLLILCAVSTVAVGLNIATQLTQAERPSLLWMLFSNLVPLALAASASLLLMLVRSTFKNSILPQVPQLSTADWEYLRHVNLVGAIDMCWMRMTSLAALASEVFMKRIRSTNYRNLYNDPRYAGKQVSDYIYTIRSNTKWNLETPPEDITLPTGANLELLRDLTTIPKPSNKLYTVAEKGASIPTLLWFQDKEDLPNLVAAGQAATCLNLMKFLRDTRDFNDERTRYADPTVHELWTTMRRDWDEFLKNPHFLNPQPVDDKPTCTNS